MADESLASPYSPPATGRAGYRGHWLAVLGLVGLDYFSTLAYQPSIAAEAAGLLAPLATAAVVLLTFLGALPVYLYIAGNAPPGQGSAALIEKHITGWHGKTLVLVLLGFAATNFVFTRTLSTADAAVHVVQNPAPAWQATLDAWGQGGARAADWFDTPLWKKCCGFWSRQLVITLLLLAVNLVLWPVVWFGFTKRLVQLAVALVALFLALTAIILGSGLLYVARHPELVDTWWDSVRAGNWGIAQPSWAGTDGWSLVKMSLWLLPKVALGLSGFELSLVVMPLVRGGHGGQVANTRKLLVVSAAVMAALLLGSALVTTLFTAPAALLPAAAHDRALAYLAHGGALGGVAAADVNPIFGLTFGTIYDIVTVTVLGLAGSIGALSVRTLLPQFLLRFGMEMRWAYSIGFIYYLFALINLGMTMVFRASVDAQRSAYAVSVLALLAVGAFAVALDLRRRGGWAYALASVPFALATFVFIMMGFGIVYYHPSSLLIAGLFIVTIIGTSILSRWRRATEFRFDGFEIPTEEEQRVWDQIRHLENSVLIAHRPGSTVTPKQKADKIRRWHRIDAAVPLVVLEVELHDPSDFVQRPVLHVRNEDGEFFLRVTRCVSVAHVIVAIGLEFSKVGEPPEIHFGWADDHPLAATVKFLLFGQGNIPYLVNDLLRRHVPNHDKRPRVVIG